MLYVHTQEIELLSIFKCIDIHQHYLDICNQIDNLLESKEHFERIVHAMMKYKKNIVYGLDNNKNIHIIFENMTIKEKFITTLFYYFAMVVNQLRK